ncbi:HAUS augmin-like complex subunit 5 [Rana temporaria]|uniref:HAUS augmin-like complex subunit 5 n=1 Tax=Rana temporaria TaxID=8407 RepID=UPI001AACD7EF|nr:HAUS augmin-like complex subunit 5 [Rana temporaria]
MDRRGLVQELRRWVTEEMGVPPQKVPPEDDLQRLSIGQCADIWKYVTCHVRSQRTVRYIDGNLLWYQQMQHSVAQRSAEEEEQQYRNRLCREILELRSELEHLQEQIQSAEGEALSQELNSEKSQDYRRRTLLLRAFNQKREEECEMLRENNTRIHYRCEQLQEVSRVSRREIIFPLVGGDSARGTLPQPEVMRDVRDVCQVRFAFLRSLCDDSITSLSGGDEFRSLAHQQWMSMGEKVWSSHPPNHIVSSLEHLALEATRSMRQLQSSLAADRSQTSSSFFETTGDGNESRDALDNSKRARSYYEGDHRYAADALPSFNGLIQEGWDESVRVTSELRSVQNQIQEVSESLAGKIQEVHKSLAEDSEINQLNRAAFDAELRCMLLRGCQDTLQQECRALEESTMERKQELKVLQQQQKNIQDSCLLLDKKQKQIQILIKGNAAAKSHIRRSSAEGQKFVSEKLLLRPPEVSLESQRLKDSVMKDAKHFSAISLLALQKLCADGVNEVPALHLSINRLTNSQCPYYKIYTSIGLSLYKAPETILSHVADMKKQLLLLRFQSNVRNQAVSKIQKKLRQSQSPDTDALLKLLSDHYAQQTDELVPKLQRLIEQCEQNQEYGAEVQDTITDWWEQPAQTCLPWEQRGGLTLQQWRDRWTLAVTALQRTSGGGRR